MASQEMYDLLEKESATKLEPICKLYFWSENFEGSSPFGVFLDLIGYSNDYFGGTLTTWASLQSVLGFMELDYLADALKVFASHPMDVEDFIGRLHDSGGDI